jgi:hypothetical protein
MNGPIEIPEYLQLAADKGGFAREHYVEADMPTTIGNVTVMPFFGDFRSQFVLSSLLLHRYLATEKQGRYFILCSYPGLAGLFPYVDEYWSVKDTAITATLMEKAHGFETGSDKAVLFRRSLREFFRDIVTWDEDLARYYNNGLTGEFFEKFGTPRIALPPLRSIKMEMNRSLAAHAGYKVFVHPAKEVQGWSNQYRTNKTDKKFWKELFDRFLDSGITPVVWTTPMCHDLSAEFSGKCVFFNDKNILDVLAIMRSCHMVLDCHTGISRYAAVARCPYLCLEERSKFTGLKEYELDDLCVVNKDYRYIFSFITILESQRWSSLLDNIVAKLNEVLPAVSRDEWPTTSEYVADVPYSVVRERKSKRIGARFIKVPTM